ncbi:MAG: Brp/Blh family beta-carotene 15,15'-dioxygenase [Planctomycetia bacterium]|nr:Brp/Blh family beta-carotene 15,15'-dioxygenase [Planctomycetia bacterium]
MAGVTAGILAVLVALVGLPHGAADHRFARPRLEPVLGMAWLPVFLTGYVAVAIAFASGWFVAPAITIVVFFLASAWHFGQEEPQLLIGPRSLRPLFRFARGGLVIWVPLVCHNAEVCEILGVVAPGGSDPAIQQATSLLTACSWIMLPIAAVAWAFQGLAAGARGGQMRRILLADNAVVASLVVLFAVASPLVSFPVYFCGWHSARGLKRLRIELGESWLELGRSLAPLTAGAITLVGLAAWLVLGGAGWNDTLIRATFVGLSAVAIPHLLLHGVAPLFDASARRRMSPPLQLGSLA